MLIIAALALAAAPSTADDKARDIEISKQWDEGASFLAPAGVTKPMFRQYSYWVELQYVLGYCTTHLKADDVRFWTTWWNDTVLGTTPVGRKLLSIGSNSYDTGLLAGEKERPSRLLCQKTGDDWFADMKRIVAEDR